MDVVAVFGELFTLAESSPNTATAPIQFSDSVSKRVDIIPEVLLSRFVVVLFPKSK